MPANAGHVLIKAPQGTFRWEEHDEKDNPQPFRRPGLCPQPVKGRVWTIENEPAELGFGKDVQLTPIQVALLALKEAAERGFGTIRVIKKRRSSLILPTSIPRYEDDQSYLVADLLARYHPDPLFTPAKDDHGNFDFGEGDSPRRWKISEDKFHLGS